MDEKMDSLVVAARVHVARPCLLHQGIVDAKTVSLVTRLFLREIIGDITGGLAEVELMVVAFSSEDEGLHLDS